MITQRETKKYRNLEGNQSVSLLIDTRQADCKNRIKALTISGTFHSSSDEKKLSDIKTSLLNINPDLKELISEPAAEIIIVKINGVQLLDGITESYFEIVT